MEFELIADGLRFPEAPVVMDDGSIIVVEIEQGRITRCWPGGRKIGRAHVLTPVTNAQRVCRLLLEKKNKTKNTHKTCVHKTINRASRRTHIQTTRSEEKPQIEQTQLLRKNKLSMKTTQRKTHTNKPYINTNSTTHANNSDT